MTTDRKAGWVMPRLLLAFFVLINCSSGFDGIAAAEDGLKTRVAVLPFENESGFGGKEFGLHVADLLDIALQQSGKFLTADRELIKKELDKKNRPPLDIRSAIDVAKAARVGLAVIGSIKSLKITPHGKAAQVKATVSASVLDRFSEKVVAVETQSVDFDTNDPAVMSGGNGKPVSASLAGNLMTQLMNSLAVKIAKRLKSRRWQGYVIDVKKDGDIWINAGLGVGVANGYRFRAFGKGKQVRSPLGETYFLPGEPKAVLEVTDTLAEVSNVSVIEGSGVKKGDLIFFVPPPDSAQRARGNAGYLHGGKMKGFYREGVLISLERKSGTGIINMGNKQGLKKDDRLVVARPEERIVDPKTGKLIKVKQTYVGELKVIFPRELDSDVKFTKNSWKIQRGDSVRRKTSAPARVKATPIGFRKIEITWLSQPEPETTEFRIYRSDISRKGPFKQVGSVGDREAISFVDEHSLKHPMEDNRKYYYQVEAINTLGKASPVSSTVSATSMAAPSPPARLTAESFAIRSVTARWETHENTGVAGYRLYRSLTKSGVFSMIYDTKSRKIYEYHDVGDGTEQAPNLKDSTAYYYRISAYSPYNDEGRKSDVVKAVTADPPIPVTEFEAKGWQVRKVPLRWDIHPDVNVRGYNLYRANNEEGPYAKIGEVKDRKENKYADGGSGFFLGSGDLEDSHIYYYKIQAYNWGGALSELTRPISAMTKALPAAPENVRTTNRRPKQIPIVWLKNPDVTIKKYEIFRANEKSGKYKKIDSVPSDKDYYLDNKLENGRTYYYKIRAVDNDGLEGDFSPVVSATTKKIPDSITGLKWTLEADKPVLRWNASKTIDFKKYIIYEKSFFGWQKAGMTMENFFIIEDLKRGSSANYSVSALEVDNLEGKRSDPITVTLP